VGVRAAASAPVAVSSGDGRLSRNQVTSQTSPATISTRNAACQFQVAITSVRTGAAISGPTELPALITPAGRARFSGGNQECTTWVASAYAGPSAKPSTTRDTSSSPKPTGNSSGTIVRIQTPISAGSSTRTEMRVLSAPTTSAPTANSQKNELCRTPNSAGVMPSSRMRALPAKPSAALSAKFRSMKAKARKVAVHAPRRRPAAPADGGVGVGTSVRGVSAMVSPAVSGRGRPVRGSVKAPGSTASKT
jgi:hypothetical protein